MLKPPLRSWGFFLSALVNLRLSARRPFLNLSEKVEFAVKLHRNRLSYLAVAVLQDTQFNLARVVRACLAHIKALNPDAVIRSPQDNISGILKAAAVLLAA